MAMFFMPCYMLGVFIKLLKKEEIKMNIERKIVITSCDNCPHENGMVCNMYNIKIAAAITNNTIDDRCKLKPNSGKWLSSLEVKIYFGIDSIMFEKCRLAGLIPFTMIGNEMFFDRDDVDNLQNYINTIKK